MYMYLYMYMCMKNVMHVVGPDTQYTRAIQHACRGSVVVGNTGARSLTLSLNSPVCK